MKNQLYFSSIIDTIYEMENENTFYHVQGMIRMAYLAKLISLEERKQLLILASEKLVSLSK